MRSGKGRLPPPGPPAAPAHPGGREPWAVRASGYAAPDQQVRVQIVALTTERALIEEPGRAVIAAGLLRAEDRFGPWLNQVVARSSA